MCVYGFTDADSIKEPKKNLMLMVEPMRTDFQMKQEKESYCLSSFLPNI